MPNQTAEFETKPTSNKDFWLLLIVLDVVALCILGFFLYKHFSKQLFNGPAAPVQMELTTQEIEPLPQVEEVALIPAEPVKEVAPETLPEPVVVPEPKPMEPVVAKAPAPEQAKPAEPKPVAVKKQSILVTPVNGSKYRRVTFRWFEPAKSVSIVSGFTNRKAQPLKKIGDLWETTLSIAPGTYKFLYVVDGKNTLDPNADEKDGRSVLIVE
ncbi:MAG: hypothetical protein J6Y25_02260 [Elusimicrobiaceae bacterium]|nr:hypothetical protein [Elusimicrobiaceae bacterium]MBP5616458.1 hypothetical protein [Elusimicrobiaceae bacterium]